MTRFGDDTSYWVDVPLAATLFGLGMALTVAPLRWTMLLIVVGGAVAALTVRSPRPAAPTGAAPAERLRQPHHRAVDGPPLVTYPQVGQVSGGPDALAVSPGR